MVPPSAALSNMFLVALHGTPQPWCKQPVAPKRAFAGLPCSPFTCFSDAPGTKPHAFSASPC